MARVSKDSAGSVSGGYAWDKAGAVIDVPDAIATQLLAIPGGGFKTVPEDAVLTPPPGEAEPLTNVPQPAVFPAGQTVDLDADETPNQIIPGLPATVAPVPAGGPAPGGEQPLTDYPHGRVADAKDGPNVPAIPEVLTEAEVVTASAEARDAAESTTIDTDPKGDADESKRPPAKAAHARSRKRVTE